MKDQNIAEKSKLEVRYRAFYLSIKVITFLETLTQKTSLKILTQQLIRCITSIGANIVEARGSSSKKEFINYFHIALKSANESKYWLAMLKELVPQQKPQIEEFLQEVDEIAKILGTSILTMKGKRKL